MPGTRVVVSDSAMRHVRFTSFALALFMMATAASATAAERVDYSKRTILAVLQQADEEEAQRLVVQPGVINYYTASTQFHLVGVLPPLPYTGLLGLRNLPNALVLNGVDLPYRPGSFVRSYQGEPEEEREYRYVATIVAKKR